VCGIFGGHETLLLSNVQDVLYHRGPNQQSTKVVDPSDQNGSLIVGQTRLNIVDRHDIRIPMEINGYTITFNGEIYNWRELRRELEKEGYAFSTNTDIEVALVSYIHWGAACLERFNGQFAFAIFDGQQFWLARDRLGKKPLFYKMENDRFAFASEMKAFESLIHAPNVLCELLEFYFDTHTPFKDLFSVPCGGWVSWSPAQGLSTGRWWQFPSYKGDITDIDDAVDEFLAIFKESCRLRQVADVPVCTFLSGGIDSSLIQIICESDVAFTIQFEEFRDTIEEEELVRDLGQRMGFDNRIITPTEEDFNALYSDFARAIEYPVGSFSIFPLYVLSKTARESGFRVALSGEGSDEIFNGYHRNIMLMQENELVQTHSGGAYRSLAEKYFGSGAARVARMAQRQPGDLSPELVKLIARDWNDEEPFEHNLARFETLIPLQPLLTMADRTSMAHGLEVRNPFLDYRLIEFSVRLHPTIRRQGNFGKLVVRRAVERISERYGRLKLLDREFKHGLPAPANLWLFHREGFERGHWNAWLIRECMHQLYETQKKLVAN